MQTVADLKQRADRALFEERYVPALQLYTAMVELQPGNLDARLRVADALLAMGDVQRAASFLRVASRMTNCVRQKRDSVRFFNSMRRSFKRAVT